MNAVWAWCICRIFLFIHFYLSFFAVNSDKNRMRIENKQLEKTEPQHKPIKLNVQVTTITCYGRQQQTRSNNKNANIKYLIWFLFYLYAILHIYFNSMMFYLFPPSMCSFSVYSVALSPFHTSYFSSFFAFFLKYSPKQRKLKNKNGSKSS